jgi:hypothetical protein
MSPATETVAIRHWTNLRVVRFSQQLQGDPTLVSTAGFNSSRQPVSHFALQPSHCPLAQLDALRESSFRLHLVDHRATESSELGDLS